MIGLRKRRKTMTGMAPITYKGRTDQNTFVEERLEFLRKTMKIKKTPPLVQVEALSLVGHILNNEEMFPHFHGLQSRVLVNSTRKNVVHYYRMMIRFTTKHRVYKFFLFQHKPCGTVRICSVIPSKNYFEEINPTCFDESRDFIDQSFKDFLFFRDNPKESYSRALDDREFYKKTFITI